MSKLSNGTRVRVVRFNGFKAFEDVVVGREGTVDDPSFTAMFTDVRLDDAIDGRNMFLFEDDEIEVI